MEGGAGRGIGVQEVGKPYGKDAKDRRCSFSATARAHNVTVFLLPACQCGPPSLQGNQPAWYLRDSLLTPSHRICGDEPRDLW